MRKIIISLLVMVVSSITSTEVLAQKFPPIDVSPMDAASYPSNWREANKLVKIVYSRPSLKARTLQQLAPAGKVWRVGANEAAEITFYKDVILGDKEVKAGTYSLFAIPNADSWTVIISNQINIWGSYFYNEKDDVVRVEAKVGSTDTPVEAFAIAFVGEEKDKATLHMGWGKTVVSIDVAAK